MTTTNTVLLESSFATASGVSYTSNNCISIIDRITATNENPAPVEAVVQLISPDGTQVQSIGKVIQQGKDWPFPTVTGHILASGGKINVFCNTTNAIRVRISGRQFT